MLYKFLLNAKFHELLSDIDNDLAMESKKDGCARCGGKLNYSNYPRSPFGVAPPFRSYYRTRCSFCCVKCRKRVTSASVRFFGRRWYCSPFFLLINALMNKDRGKSIQIAQRHLRCAISKRTWMRWRRWWDAYFPTTPFWEKLKGIIPLFILNGPFPRVFFKIYSERLMEKVIHILRLIAPITAGDFRAV